MKTGLIFDSFLFNTLDMTENRLIGVLSIVVMFIEEIVSFKVFPSDTEIFYVLTSRAVSDAISMWTK